MRLKRTLHKDPTLAEFGIRTNTGQPPLREQYDPAQYGQRNSAGGRKQRSGGAAALTVLVICLAIAAFLFVRHLGRTGAAGHSTAGHSTASSSSVTGQTGASGRGSKPGERYNYYKWEGKSSDTVSFINPADLGSQRADMTGTPELYITNILSDGDMVGDEQEVLLIPWRDEWTDGYKDWGIGEFNVSLYDYRGADISYRYYYTSGRTEYIYDSFGSKVRRSKIKKVDLHGENWLTFTAVDEYKTGLYAIREYGDDGILVCRLNFEPRDESTKTPDTDALLEDLCGNIMIKTSDLAEITAVSPFASRTIRLPSEDGSTEIEAEISMDHRYEEQLSEQYPDTRGMLRSFTWWKKEASTAERRYNSAGSDSMLDYEHESILYRFYTADTFRLSEIYNGLTGLGTNNVHNINIGEEQVTEINGMDVHYRFTSCDYTLSNKTTPYQTISIWIECDDSYLYIMDRFDRTADSPEERMDEIVQRLAGDNLKISYS